MNGADGDGAQRRRFFTHGLPLVGLATLAFVAGLIAGAGGDGASAAERFATAWERGDFAAMYAELAPDARSRHSRREFEAAYENAAETATVQSIDAGETGEGEDDVDLLDVTVDTYAFGELRSEVALPIADGIAWEPHMVFPGLEPDETLSRRTRAAERAPILAADGEPLAEGPAAARALPLGSAAGDVVGSVGAPEPPLARELATRGFPAGSLTGISGIELAYNERLAGVPGGQLLATTAAEEPSLTGGRVLATTEPQPGKPVRTSIDTELQEAAVAALGALYGGVAVLDARKGDVLALAGIAFSAPQPPGSTFKVVTTVGALDAGIVKLSDEFPVESTNSEIGREIANSHDAPCGGTFRESFAQSCNTVFAPLGARLGGEKLVETAERFGFNAAPLIYEGEAAAAIDPPASTLPTELTSDVEAGVTAIGQGEVLATPLQMASVAQTIANGGVRMPTAIARGKLGPNADPVQVTSKRIAATVRDLMVGVIEGGTGTAADLPNTQVAGKTGTAELGPAPLEEGQELDPDEEPPQELDAWFTAFAPAPDPKLAIAVLVVDAEGDGGEIAAPIAAEILAAGLG